MTEPQIYWALLMERNINGHTVDAALDIAGIAALKKYPRISVPYMRTDMARNRIAKSFLELAGNPNDAIIMLDCDHIHPQETLVKLASQEPERGVVGALYFRRGEPYDPLFFVRLEDGRLSNPAEWDLGYLYECDAVATGAMLIRRWVFDKLIEAGHGYPWFQYTYPEEAEFSMTEDIFFAGLCEQVGIHHYCDTSLVTPHLGIQLIGPETWDAYKLAHPEILVDPETVGQEKEHDSTQ